MGIADYSATPGSNTTLNGISVSDSSPPDTVDNMVRQLMADIRTAFDDLAAKNTSAGTDTITLTTSQTLTAYADGTVLGFIAGGTNTGAATLNVDSVGAKAVVKGDGSATALSAGDIVAGMPVVVVYDASVGAGSWLMVNPISGLTGYITASSTATLTNKTFDANGTGNSLSNVEVADMAAAAVVTESEGISSNDNDTSFPTSAAVHDHVVGKFTVGVHAGGLTPTTTNGCAAVAQGETTTNKINYLYLAFDASAEEKAFFWMPSPKSYDASTVTMRAVWTHPSTATNFGVVWEFEILAVANDDALDTAVGTAITVTDTGGTTEDFYITAESAAITPGNTAAKQDWLYVQVSRKAADGSDSLAVDAHLIGVEVFYTTDAATDD